MARVLIVGFDGIQPERFHTLPFHASVSGARSRLPGNSQFSTVRRGFGPKPVGGLCAMAEPLTHHGALVYVMVTISAVDRSMTDSELARIGQIVSHLPVFADYDQEQLVKTAEACGEVLSTDEGLERVFSLVRGALPKKLRETAYAVALEVAAADREVKHEEIRFLEMLGDALELDKLTMAALERGIRARNTIP